MVPLAAAKMANENSSTPVVMKFGGSSVADLDHLRRVAQIVEARARLQPVVVVVSAMGKTTNRLVEQARALCTPPAPRELDMLLTTGERTSMALLALALHGRGVSAISLTGSQCGVITNHQHGSARIVDVRPFRIQDELAAGHVVVVGGFQGVSYKREVTTLGRGGSDTSAVALAAALGADCEIYSDVDGIYDGDPRKLPEATRLEELGYEEMQAMSRAGARVLHARAVELAAQRDIAIHARASFPKPGREGQTVIRRNPARVAIAGVRAVTCDPAVVDIHLRLTKPGSAAIQSLLGRALGGLGLRYLHIGEHGARGLLLTTGRDDASSVELAVGESTRALRTMDPSLVDHVGHRGGLALTTLVGAGLEERADLVDQALGLLEEAGITVHGIRTDGQSMGLLVQTAHAEAATALIHETMIT